MISFHEGDKSKYKIITNGEEFLRMVSKNYFLKLKIPEDELTCALISGRIYNKVIKNSNDLNGIDGLVFEHFCFLC